MLASCICEIHEFCVFIYFNLNSLLNLLSLTFATIQSIADNKVMCEDESPLQIGNPIWHLFLTF